MAAKQKSYQKSSELLKLMNVGSATYNDLQLLGITSTKQLAGASADELYVRLQKITGHAHDPCVWDIFAAAINEARTGERQPWWEWTKIRKKRQLEGNFLK
jgi:nucleotidyltransferase/DNA polymerase involved in DNA repair